LWSFTLRSPELGRKEKAGWKRKKSQNTTVKSKNTKSFLFFSFWFDLSTGSIHVTVLSVDKKLGVASKTCRQRGVDRDI